MATGRNPRYLSHVDLTGVAATTIEQAPVAEANLAVVAVPSAAFGATVAALPGTCPILSLTKGLDPATGNRLSTLVDEPPRGGALRPEHRRRDLAWAARRGRDRR